MTEQPPTPVKLLKPEVVAEWASISLRTVRRLLLQKKIPSVRIGGQYRIHPDALDSIARRARQRPKRRYQPVVAPPKVDLVGDLTDAD